MFDSMFNTEECTECKESCKPGTEMYQLADCSYCDYGRYMRDLNGFVYGVFLDRNTDTATYRGLSKHEWFRMATTGDGLPDSLRCGWHFDTEAQAIRKVKEHNRALMASQKEGGEENES